MPSGRTMRYSDAVQAAACAYYDQGGTTGNICRMLGCTRWTLHRILKRHGVARRRGRPGIKKEDQTCK